MIDYFIIYETTNLINGKKYRGIHKTQNLNDGYLGSGVALKNAIIKYGKESFKREILEYSKSYEELIEKEKIYVNLDWIKSNENYNLKTGGQSTGLLSEESRKKLSNTLKEGYKSGRIVQNSPNKGISMPYDIRKKVSDTLKEKYKNMDHPSKGIPVNLGENNGMFGKDPWNKGLKGVQPSTRKGIKSGPESDETKLKKSISAKERYKNNVHPSKGKPSLSKGKSMPKFECPHCGKLSNKGNLFPLAFR